MTDTLAGRTILVTGGSGDIGAAVVRRVAAEGARPIIHFERNRMRAEALLAEICGAGWIVHGDLARGDGLARLWRDALSVSGRVHGLVSNAGVRTEIGLDAAVADIPVGEMGAPEEIAELVAFALRPSQRSLNGATLDVNGGGYIH